jgi:predicted amidohydrolase YtcJ
MSTSAAPGSTKLNVDLTGVKSLAEMLAKIQTFAADVPAGHWLTGGNWDHTLWASKTLPTRQDLDKVTGDHPTFLGRIDGHIAIANTAALKAAGITGKTVPPQGGAIDLDASGEPTGILRESAQDLIEKVIPPPSHDERRRGDELAIADALATASPASRTSATGTISSSTRSWKRKASSICASPSGCPSKPAARPHEDARPPRPNDPMLHTGFLKGFMDGSLGSRTAALNAPYADDPGNTGLPQYTQDQLNKMAVERAQAGFQLGFHAIGDKATAMALNAYQRTCESSTIRSEGIKVEPMVPRC